MLQNITKKYFVCDRYRQTLSLEYIKKSYKKGFNNHRKLHNTKEEAEKEMRNGFYDDSDYAVIEVTNGNKFKILR